MLINTLKKTLKLNSEYNFLEALANGDDKLIYIIYKKNFPNIKNFIIANKGQVQDAEDIFQKGLMQLSVRYRKKKFEISSSFEAYFYTVCKNLWRRELNKKKIRVTDDKIKELVNIEHDNALALIEMKRQELFIEKLNLISQNCKKILDLYFSRISYSEIVKLTNYDSENVVRQRVFKCKKHLTKLIIEDNKFSFLKE